MVLALVVCSQIFGKQKFLSHLLTVWGGHRPSAEHCCQRPFQLKAEWRALQDGTQLLLCISAHFIYPVCHNVIVEWDGFQHLCGITLHHDMGWPLWWQGASTSLCLWTAVHRLVFIAKTLLMVLLPCFFLRAWKNGYSMSALSEWIFFRCSLRHEGFMALFENTGSHNKNQGCALVAENTDPYLWYSI